MDVHDKDSKNERHKLNFKLGTTPLHRKALAQKKGCCSPFLLAKAIKIQYKWKCFEIENNIK